MWERLKLLGAIAARAKRKARRAEEKKWEAERAEEMENDARSPDGKPKIRPTKSGVNIRLKSLASDFDLEFRVAPSKKHPDLYNFAVYAGGRILRYVEVEPATIVSIGKQLQELRGGARRRNEVEEY